jgi:predicted permease
MADIPGLRRIFRLPWRSRRALDDDFQSEVDFHLEMRAEELAAKRGIDADEARAEALRQFGDVDDARSYIRAIDRRQESAIRRRESWSGWWQDLAHSVRSLRRSPGFSIVVILALALGIGSVTAIFTLLNATRLRPLSVPQPEQLVAFGDPTRVGTTEVGPPRTDIFSYPLYEALRDGSRIVPSLMASGFSSKLEIVRAAPANEPDAIAPAAGDAQEAEHPRGRLVSGNYFDVLRVAAHIGRTLTPEDDRARGASPVAVISHAYWQRGFEGSPSVLGRVLIVNRTPVTIVGVTPPEFDGEISGSRTDIWLPLTMQPLLLPNQEWLEDPTTSWLLLMGRLAPGVSPERAGEELTVLARRELSEVTGALSTEAAQNLSVPAAAAPRGFNNMPPELRTVLAMLFALAGLVLLVVAANVANLLLARASARSTEIGVRMALGAGRVRVVRHLLAESLLLGAAGGMLALLVIRVAHSLVVRRLEADGASLPVDLSIDARVFAFAAGLSVVTALLLGLVPALRVTGAGAGGVARGGGGTGSSGGRSVWGRRLPLSKLLVAGQVAVSLTLLSGAGLLVRSLDNLRTADFGMVEQELLIVALDLNPLGHTGARGELLRSRLAERLQAIPGVRAVAYSQNGLFSGIEGALGVEVDGESPPSDVEGTTNFDQVSAGYFRTIGARLLRGRGIEATDDERAPRVAVINESMARAYFATPDAVGRTFRVDTTRHTVVGVVADVRGQSLRATPTRRFYTPLAQGGEAGLVVFELRVDGDPARLRTAARNTVLEAEPLLRIRSIESLSSLMEESLGAQRLIASLAAIAGTLALALAALGLYGVMSYAIVRRTREFGVRMALGARPAEITGLVLRESLWLCAIGSALGIPASLLAARLLRHELTDVGLVDLPSLVLAVTVLAVTSALAAYRPARRAAGVEPRVALTSD